MRRGIEKTTLVGLMLLLAAIVILWPFAADAAQWAQGYAEGGVCGASATMASLRVEGPLCFSATPSASALQCPKSNFVIGSQEARKHEEGRSESIRLSGETSAQGASTLVAQELESCWRKLGSGEVALFPQAAPGWANVLAGRDDATACHVCAEVSFEEGVDLSGSSVQDALRAGDNGDRLLDELNDDDGHCRDASSSSEGCWSGLEEHFTSEDGRLSRIDELDATKTYAIVMLRQGFPRCEDDVQEPQINMFSYVVPDDELSSACDAVFT